MMTLDLTVPEMALSQGFVLANVHYWSCLANAVLDREQNIDYSDCRTDRKLKGRIDLMGQRLGRHTHFWERELDEVPLPFSWSCCSAVSNNTL